MKSHFFGWRDAACLMGLIMAAPNAEAIPSFAEQTGQPCAACHVGAFGPQLKPYGRDFKLYGYTSSDGQPHLPTVAVAAQSSFTHTNAPQPGGVPPGFSPNDNWLADDQDSIFYGGRIAPGAGAFVQVTYSGAAHAWMWDSLDLRFAHSTEWFKQDTVFGFTVNNGPAIADLWNSTPPWGFPYTSSPVAPSPNPSTLVDGNLSAEVLGAGGYVMWNDLLYVEADAYQGLNASLRNRLGTGPRQGGLNDAFDGVIPYGRIALEHATERHYVQAGAFVIAANLNPDGIHTPGSDDSYLDRAVDANYQFIGNETHFVSAHAVYIDERQDLGYSRFVHGTLPHDGLRTGRLDLSYSYDNTWTPSVQYFHTTGSTDAAQWRTANGSPDSAGYIAEIAYVPLGKPKSVPAWFNARISVQYVGYHLYNGTADQARGQNTLYLNLWIAFAPFYAVEKHAGQH